MKYRHPEKRRNKESPYLKKPHWIRGKAPSGKQFYDTKKIIIDTEECNLQEKYLNKYLLQDISNIIVQYYV